MSLFIVDEHIDRGAWFIFIESGVEAMSCSPRVWRNFALIFSIALISYVAPAQTEPQAPSSMPPPASPTCENVPHSDHPHARITNGRMNAVLFLPDQTNGYYRAARFDWSGIVACASLNGHTFFGEWFHRYDPMTNDAVTGPSEEFREPLGYDDAKPGDAFVKVGDGVLKRIDDRPYQIGTPFPYLDHGKWTVKVRKNSVTFRQQLHSSLGYDYIYEKVVSLDKKANVLHLSHSLKNIGSKPIDTTVYAHDFFMLDNKTTGPGDAGSFPVCSGAIEGPTPIRCAWKAARSYGFHRCSPTNTQTAR